ncbi:hypothetical protein EDD15DRAFT_2374268 [Pisolithus albus]|nr:hypothetical protein EDD15DRAFT_2374268 [Pisolithus albus]
MATLLTQFEQLHKKAGKGFEHLEKDADFLEEIFSEAQSTLPGLRREYDQLVEELEQNYPKELKASIAERGMELDNCHREVRKPR